MEVGSRISGGFRVLGGGEKHPAAHQASGWPPVQLLLPKENPLSPAKSTDAERGLWAP